MKEKYFLTIELTKKENDYILQEANKKEISMSSYVQDIVKSTLEIYHSVDVMMKALDNDTKKSDTASN